MQTTSCMKQCHSMTKQLGMEGTGHGLDQRKQAKSRKVLTLKMVLVCARDLQQVVIEDKKILKQILTCII